MMKFDWRTPLDSKEGIEALFVAARTMGLVLCEAHQRIARKHSVSTDGVVISRRVPT